MIVMGMTDDDGIDDRNVLDLARDWCIAFGTQPREWRATVFEDRIEEHAQT